MQLNIAVTREDGSFKTLEELEVDYLVFLMRCFDNEIIKVVRASGMPRATFYRKYPELRSRKIKKQNEQRDIST